MTASGGEYTTARQIEYIRRSWPAHAETTTVAVRAVRQWLADLGLGSTAISTVSVAVGEALTNACTHAYPPDRPGHVDVALWTDDLMLFIEVIDHGRWRAPPGDDVGAGFTVMSGLAESTLIRFDAQGTRVLLRHRLDGPATPLAAR